MFKSLRAACTPDLNQVPYQTCYKQQVQTNLVDATLRFGQSVTIQANEAPLI